MKPWKTLADRLVSVVTLVMLGILVYRYLLPRPSLPLGDLDRQTVVAPGQVTLIELSATYCPACISMRPIMGLLTQRYQDQAVIKVLELDKPEHQAEARKLAQSVGLRYTPTFVVTDHQGRVIAKYVGPTSYAALSGSLEQALKLKG